MGPGILIPLVVIAIVVPVAFAWARTRLKGRTSPIDDQPVPPPTARLTSTALRELPTPPWRVVHEIPDDRLGGIEHVLLGPPGVFGVRTSMEPLPAAPIAEPSAADLARPAIARSALDDALGRCGMSSDRLVTVHWGVNPEDSPPALDLVPGHTAVDGRRLSDWAAGTTGQLPNARVDLAWQTVTTAIGRPDPMP